MKKKHKASCKCVICFNYHRKAKKRVRRSNRSIRSQEYRHERISSSNKFSPDSFRTVKRNRHRIIIGCPIGQWDFKAKRCRVGMQTQAILHPQGERKCKVKKNPGAAWHRGVAHTLKTGPGRKSEFIKGAVFAHKSSAAMSKKMNMNPRGAVKIYDKIEKIYAQKGKASLYPGEKFVHKFNSPAAIYGLPGGDILIKSKSGKKLWSQIKQK